MVARRRPDELGARQHRRPSRRRRPGGPRRRPARRPLPAPPLPQRVPVVVADRRGGLRGRSRPVRRRHPPVVPPGHAPRRPEPGRAGDLRSEQVTVLLDHGGDVWWSVRRRRHHDGTSASAGPAGATASRWSPRRTSVAPCWRRCGRALHPVGCRGRRRRAPLLEAWADEVGAAAGPGGGAVPGGLVLLVPLLPLVTEGDSARTWPSPATGPSRCSSSTTATSPPSATGSSPTTSSPRARPPRRGHRRRRVHAGIWMAPFLAAPDSEVAPPTPTGRPASRRPAQPMIGWCNPVWGGFLRRPRHHPARRAGPPRRVAACAGRHRLRLPEAGLHLCARLAGGYADPTRRRPSGSARATRPCAGAPATTRSSSAAAAPLGPGRVVDGMRIGPDVGPSWVRRPTSSPPGYEGGEPRHPWAWRSTSLRAFMHRKLWLNDPDCIMLRTCETPLRPSRPAPGPWPSVCRAAWPSCPTTWPSSDPRAGAPRRGDRARPGGGRRPARRPPLHRPARRRPAGAAGDGRGRARRRTPTGGSPTCRASLRSPAALPQPTPPEVGGALPFVCARASLLRDPYGLVRASPRSPRRDVRRRRLRLPAVLRARPGGRPLPVRARRGRRQLRAGHLPAHRVQAAPGAADRSAQHPAHAVRGERLFFSGTSAGPMPPSAHSSASSAMRGASRSSPR